MGLSDDLNQASQYTGSIFQRIGELIILFIISIIPIVSLIAIGYYARIVRDSPSSKKTPKLESYTDMFIEGLKIFVVAIIWAIIIIIIAVIIAIPLIILGVVSAFTSSTNFFSIGWIFALGAYLVIFGVIAFLLGIVAFIGIIHMIKNNSFGKAFAFREIIGVIGKIGWLRYLAFFVIFFVASAILGIIVSALSPVGWIIGALLSVLLGLFASRTIGLLYDGAIGFNTPPSSVPPPPPAYT
jgi:hypothetical protein